MFLIIKSILCFLGRNVDFMVEICLFVCFSIFRTFFLAGGRFSEILRVEGVHLYENGVNLIYFNHILPRFEILCKL